MRSRQKIRGDKRGMRREAASRRGSARRGGKRGRKRQAYTAPSFLPFARSVRDSPVYASGSPSLTKMIYMPPSRSSSLQYASPRRHDMMLARRKRSGCAGERQCEAVRGARAMSAAKSGGAAQRARVTCARYGGEGIQCARERGEAECAIGSVSKRRRRQVRRCVYAR